MNIGDLRHRITFQKLISTVNENGFKTEDWQDYKTIWASVSNLTGKEYYQAAAIQAEKTVKFKVRYFEDIDTSMRILFKDSKYNINSIDNREFTNKYLEIKALEVEGSG